MVGVGRDLGSGHGFKLGIWGIGVPPDQGVCDKKDLDTTNIEYRIKLMPGLWQSIKLVKTVKI